MNKPTDQRDPYMKLLRELVESYQAFEGYAIPHIKAQGLTPAQFDVIATLGNTDGMTFKELGERTLLYKTTLTSVVDRLEARGWVERVPSRQDRRSTIARLTDEGAALFQRVFPAHRDFLKERFEQLTAEEIETGIAFLGRLRQVFRDNP
ncbi:DNA-binding MarR family transcriptional regulator [Natronocella acetinitrilica]|uniref:DNA-binding MarR family transcriptional regulator n=1 Tax=Natronocella acetinitrilica TaxID=414046 RepID=A0AAE3G4B5_9GAMM|nr:MarR family transcriptional regulator [Natronocella acetinitrilica]MCP1675555.1 DNA-binding MarR family transcriptional regulator [Natronocella acetinitrilica]